MADTNTLFSLLGQYVELQPLCHPWEEVQTAFSRMNGQTARKLLEQRPDILAKHLWLALRHEQFGVVNVIVSLLRQIGPEAIRDHALVASVIVAAEQNKDAAYLLKCFGMQRSVDSCVGMCSAEGAGFGDLAVQAFEVLCKSRLRARDQTLANSLRSLCQTLPKDGPELASHREPWWNAFYAACSVITHLLSVRRVSIPQIEDRLQELAICPRLEQECFEGDVLPSVIRLIELMGVIREHYTKGAYPDGQGHRQSIPGARAFILTFCRRFWVHAGRRHTVEHGFASDALRAFPAVEVTEVVLAEFLPNPIERTGQVDAGPLRIVAEMCVEAGASSYFDRIISYCRQGHSVKFDGGESPVWPVLILALLGDSGAALIREFLLEPGQTEARNWSNCAREAYAEALGRCTVEESAPHHNAVLDAVLGDDIGRRNRAICTVSHLNHESRVLLGDLALKRIEAERELPNQAQADLLWVIDGVGSYDFAVDDRTLDRAIAAGTERHQSDDLELRLRARVLLARILNAICPTDPKGKHQSRISQLADTAVVGLGDEDAQIRKLVRHQLCESTNDERHSCALAILMAALGEPSKAVFRDLLESIVGHEVVCEVSTWMIGVDDYHVESLKRALVCENRPLRKLAAELCPWVLKHASADNRSALLNWLESQRTLPRGRWRRLLPAVLNFARHCPDLAGAHGWIVENAARCRSWDPAQKLRILKLLCGPDVERFANLLAEHDASLVAEVDGSEPATSSALALALVAAS